MKFETKIKVAASAIILVMSTVAAPPMLVNRQVTTVMSELRSASNVERLHLTLLDMLLNAETAQRGFVVTGDERFLDPYHTAVNGIPTTQEAVRTGGEVRSAAYAGGERARGRGRDLKRPYRIKRSTPTMVDTASEATR